MTLFLFFLYITAILAFIKPRDSKLKETKLAPYRESKIAPHYKRVYNNNKLALGISFNTVSIPFISHLPPL